MALFLYRNPRILILVLGVISVAGLSSFFLMPRLEDPVLGKRVGVISTVYPGADSNRVESLVTIRIEDRLSGISEIGELRSNSRTGISNIVIRLSDDVDDVDPVWAKIRDQLRDIETDLPEGCFIPDFEVFQLKAYAAIVALKLQNPEQFSVSVLRKLANLLQQRISNLSGTQAVDIFGYPEEEYLVEIEPTVLASLQLSTAAIASQIAANNTTHPMGYSRGAESQLLLDQKSDDSNLQQLEESIIRFGPTGESAKVSEIATVKKSPVVPAHDYALIDGQQAVVFGAFFDDRMRVDLWSEQLQQVLNDFQAEYASEIDVEIIFSQQDFISKRLDALLQNLLIGTSAVVLVVLVLMGWRSMIVVGITLPLTSLIVLSAMRFLEIPMHQMSITGLIIALGLLIDNAIVMVEDIRARLFAGVSSEQAIGQSVRHLAMPLFGSTLTTAFAFTPIATLPGPPGEFVGAIAMNVILAISASFVLAMTVVPTLLVMMGVDSTKRGFLNYGITNQYLEQLYQRVLGFVFRHPLIGIGLSLVLPIAGFVFAKQLPEQFFPPSDRKQIQIEMELYASEPIEKTLSAVKLLNETVQMNQQVQHVHWFLGRSAPTFYYNVVPRRRGTPFYAQAIVELKDNTQIATVVREIQQELDVKHAACRSVVRQLEQGPPIEAPIELKLIGPDLDKLQTLGNQLRLILSSTDRVIHTRSDSEETLPKLLMGFDLQELSSAGFSETEIAQFLYTTLEGAPAGKLLDGDEELAVRVKMMSQVDGQVGRLASLQALQLISNRGPTIGPDGKPQGNSAAAPLASVADFELGSDRAALVRINRERTNEIKVYTEAGALPSEVLAEFKQRLRKSDFRLPLGYRLEIGGENAERTHAVQRLIANAGVLFLLMILALVVSFRSFRGAFIIVAVGGLAIGLGPLALWLFGYPFGFMAIVGTMGLVGVAINDSIVVLAGIVENPQASAGNIAELTKVVVGSTRHIIATTITTIAGFLPLILSGGEFWPPLAITIAGGVGGATFLALFFVPSLSLLLFQKTKSGELT